LLPADPSGCPQGPFRKRTWLDHALPMAVRKAVPVRSRNARPGCGLTRAISDLWTTGVVDPA
jgi:hypothetical protein